MFTEKLGIFFLIIYTHPAVGERNCSLLLMPQQSRKTESSMTPVSGRLTTGQGGGSRTLRPQMVVRFFISLPHLNLFRLFVSIASMDSLRTCALTSRICNEKTHASERLNRHFSFELDEEERRNLAMRLLYLLSMAAVTCSNCHWRRVQSQCPSRSTSWRCKPSGCTASSARGRPILILIAARIPCRNCTLNKRTRKICKSRAFVRKFLQFKIAVRSIYMRYRGLFHLFDAPKTGKCFFLSENTCGA